MLVGCMVYDEIDEHANAALLRLRCKPVPIVHGSVLPRDTFVVRNIVSEICVGRREKRSNPYCVNSKALQVIQPGCDTVQVPDAVAVCVLETSWVNFVDDGAVVPMDTPLLGH